MAKFEYRVIYLRDAQWSDEYPFDWRNPKNFPKDINTLGADGWELVSVVLYQPDGAYHLAYFKREIKK